MLKHVVNQRAFLLQLNLLAQKKSDIMQPFLKFFILKRYQKPFIQNN